MKGELIRHTKKKGLKEKEEERAVAKVYTTGVGQS